MSLLWDLESCSGTFVIPSKSREEVIALTCQYHSSYHTMRRHRGGVSSALAFKWMRKGSVFLHCIKPFSCNVLRERASPILCSGAHRSWKSV